MKSALLERDAGDLDAAVKLLHEGMMNEYLLCVSRIVYTYEWGRTACAHSFTFRTHTEFCMSISDYN